MFLVILIHFGWINTYFGTVEKRIEDYTLDKDKVVLCVEIFSAILPATFILSPIISKIIHVSGYINSFWITHFLAFLWTAFSMIEITDLQIANFLVFSILRGFFFSITMGYIIEIFGFKNFGKLWGTAYLFSGFGSLFQYILLKVTVDSFYGDFMPLGYLQATTVFLASFFPSLPQFYDA